MSQGPSHVRAIFPVNAPGKITDEWGLEHSFDLVAEHQDKPKEFVVLDALTEKEKMMKIIAFKAKTIGIILSIQIMAAFNQLNENETELVDQYGFKVVNAKTAVELAAKMIGEVKLWGR